MTIVINKILDLLNHLLHGVIIDLAVFDNGLAEMMADLLKHISVKVEISVLSEISTAKRSF